MYECPFCGGLVTNRASRFGVIPTSCICTQLTGHDDTRKPDCKTLADAFRADVFEKIRDHYLAIADAVWIANATYWPKRKLSDEPETVTIG